MKVRIILLSLSLSLTLALVFAGNATASLAPPLKINREGTPSYAEVGTAYTGSFRLQAKTNLEVELFEVAGDGWSNTFLSAPSALLLVTDETYDVTFGGQPSATAGPLYLEYAIDGKSARRVLDPGPRGSAKRRQAVTGVSTPLPDRPIAKSEPVDRDIMGPVPPPRQKARAPELKTIFDESNDMGGDPAKRRRTITVTGRVHFILPSWTDELTGDVYPGDSSRGARGVTVRVWDEDSTWDDFMGDGLTDDDGHFSVTVDWDPCFTCDSTPDIYVEFEAANSRIEVEDSVWEINYYMETATWDDYSGSSLSVGGNRFSDEDLQPVFFILTHASRAFDMILDISGRTQDTVDYQFPGNGNYYLTLWEEIHISQARGFNSGTVVHEYGHHFIENYGSWGSRDTCNGVCDDDSGFIEELFGSCGHCAWCAESAGVAWNEGFPQWMADLYAREHLSNKGYWPATYRLFETTENCGTATTPDSFNTTEGRVASMLRDLEDAEADNDLTNSLYPDALNGSAGWIFAVADLDEPTSGIGFFLDYRARYNPPEPQLWETVTNAGYPNYDNTPPGPPTNFISQSHTVGVPTPAYKIFINWDAAPDDISQVAKYVYSFSENAPMSPNPNAAGTTDQFGKSVQLNPGIWYANILSQDRAGNTSSSYAIGPFTISEFPDPDLAFVPRGGWADPVVPSGANTLSDGNVPAPVYLVGNNSSGTYWNAVAVSLGPAGVPAGTEMRVFVDGKTLPELPWDPIDDEAVLANFNEAPAIVLNRGPLSVPGGRHVFAVHGDASELVFESDEDNNVSGRSWVWSPAPLTEGVDTYRNTPPNLIDGWYDITEGGLYFNCDGLQFESTGWWNAVTVVPVNATSNLDLRLHQPSTGASNGFIAPLGYSTRSIGRTDAVLVNRNLMGQQLWDVAVSRVPIANDYSPFNVRHITSTAFTFGDSIGVTMAAAEMMTLHEVNVPFGQEGTVEITVRTDPAQGPLRISWYDRSFDTGDINDDDGFAVTDAFGFARFSVQAPVSHYYCVGISRDMSDANGVNFESFSLEIGAPGIDISVYTPPNWSSPLVPWEDTDDLNGPIVVPASLPGFDENFIHTATRNLSSLAAPGAYQQTIRLDDASLPSPFFAAGYAGADSLKQATPTEIPGGRHTLWLQASFPGWETLDTNPSNNYWAEQFVWRPWQLVMDTPVRMDAPSDPVGGWGAFVNPVQAAPELSFNCVGARTPLLQPAGPNGHWAAIAATPTDSLGNIDLRLHDELSTGSKSGFEASFLTSNGGGLGQTEFALVNPNLLGHAQFDVGVMQGAGALAGADGFKISATSSQYLGSQDVTPVGEYGPWNIPVGRTLALFEIWLDAGTHEITLRNLAGGGRLGLSIHGGAGAFARGSADSSSGTAWLEPAGVDEQLTLVVTNDGYHAVAVWKAGWADLEQSAQFGLFFTNDSVSGVVPGAGQLVTGIREVRPNPFNPQTTVAFEVEQAGQVEVSIFDLRGQKVRVLQSGHLGSGRHQRVWNGRDEAGRQVATGTYLVRLRGGGKIDHRKIMLIK